MCRAVLHARLQPRPAGHRRGRHQPRRPRACCATWATATCRATSSPARSEAEQLADGAWADLGRTARRAPTAGSPGTIGGDAVMTALRSIPRSVRWTVPLGTARARPRRAVQRPRRHRHAVGRARPRRASPPAPPGRCSGWSARMERQAARPWRVIGRAARCCSWSPSCWPAPSPARRSTASGSTTSCSSSAPPRRWSPAACSPAGSAAPAGRRWSSTALIITAALLVVTEVLRAPLVNPVDAPDDLRSLVLAYGGVRRRHARRRRCPVHRLDRRAAPVGQRHARRRRLAGRRRRASRPWRSSRRPGCGPPAPTSPSPSACRPSSSPPRFAPTRFADRSARAAAPAGQPARHVAGRRRDAQPAAGASALMELRGPAALPRRRDRLRRRSSRSWPCAWCCASARTAGSPRTSSAARRTSAG